MAYRTIKTFASTFGGYAYRATSNGATIHLQRRAAGTRTFRTFYVMSVQAWESAAETYGIYDIYCDDPAALEHIAHA